ncbi:MAG TPA: hypothetical protein VFQ65_14025 [Kofleriaceae bacterium]|nr:hypothetical protein [Kofleriaceae bacterium]
MKRVALALLVMAACKNGPSQDQCKQLQDHLVDLEFKAGGAGGATAAAKQELEKSKAAVSDATATAFLETCTKKMTRTRVECALAANSLDGDSGVGKCDESK